VLESPPLDEEDANQVMGTPPSRFAPAAAKACRAEGWRAVGGPLARDQFGDAASVDDRGRARAGTFRHIRNLRVTGQLRRSSMIAVTSRSVARRTGILEAATSRPIRGAAASMSR
jgi:hypothetical protein